MVFFSVWLFCPRTFEDNSNGFERTVALEFTILPLQEKM
jgi:hypothetical protein